MEKYKWVFEILFSGLGTAILGYLFFKHKNEKQIKQNQKSGNNSINIQAGENINVNNSKEKKR